MCYIIVYCRSAEDHFLIHSVEVPGYFFIEQLKEVVPKFPDTTFVFVDGVTDIAGMASIKYLENEGSFLAGALAAGLTSMVCNLTIGKKKYQDAEDADPSPVIQIQIQQAAVEQPRSH